MTMNTGKFRQNINAKITSNSKKEISGLKVREVLVDAADAIDEIFETFSLIDGLGNYNANTGVANIKETDVNFTPVLVANQPNGKFFIIDVEGTQSITGTARLMKVGGLLVSRGTKWDYIPPADTGFNDVQKLKENIPQNIALDRYAFPFVDPQDKLYGGFLVSGEFEAIKFLNDSIDGGAIKSGAITSDKISAGAIDESNLSEDVVNKLNSFVPVVYYPTTALEALAEAARRRVDLIMFSDSNGKFNGDGWDAGFNYAMGQRFAQYASAMYSARNSIANEGVSTTTGFGVSHTAAGTLDTIPNEFNNYLLPVPGKESAYNADGDFSSDTGMIKVNFNSPLGSNNLLRAHFKVVKFPGGGTFRPGWRRETSPYTILNTGAVFSFASPEIQEDYHTVDLPAGERGFDVAVKYRLPSGSAAVGPNMILSSRVENPNALSGYSISHFYAVGGQSLWDMAEYLKTNSLRSIANYLSDVRRLQVLAGQKPILVIYINSGVNDKNETSTPSQGWRSDSDPDGATSYLDNLEAIRDRLIDAYQFNGYDKNELFFLVMPSHPIIDPDDSELASYRKAAKAFCASPRCSMVDLTQITSYTEISTNGWYSGGTDVNHLLVSGSNELAKRVIDKYVPVIS